MPHTQSIEPQNPTRLGLPILPKSPILGLGLALGAGLGLEIFFDLRIWAALGIKANCSGITHVEGFPKQVSDVS